MIVSRYLSRRVGGYVLAVLAGLLALGVTIDLIEHAAEVIAAYGLPGLARYVVLRAPLVLLFIAPLGTLVGALLAFLGLAARSELLILRASGLSTLGLLVRLLPLALFLGLLHFGLVGHLAPATERMLVAGMPKLFKNQTVAHEFWLRDRRSVIRVGRALPDGTRLEDLSIFTLAPAGELTARIDAARAVFGPSGWRLEEVVRRRYGRAPERLAALEWETRLTPPAILGAAYRPQLIDLREARAVLRGALPGGRGVPFYEIHIWRSYAAGAVPMVMLIFAALASFGFARGGGRPWLAALGLGAGAVYVLTDGVLGSLGEVGAIGPKTAAFLAPGLFASLGIWSIMVVEE